MGKRFKIACCLITWGEEAQTDLEKVLQEVKDAGYDGVESIVAKSVEEFVDRAALAARMGLQVVNILGSGSQEEDIRRYAALGRDAAEIWAPARSEYNGGNPTDEDFKRCAHEIEGLIELTIAHGMKPYHHAHVGTILETKEDIDRLLHYAPRLWLLLDTGHLLARHSDPVEVLRAHGPRIAHVHLKDFYSDDPDWSYLQPNAWETGQFELLGKGNRGLNVPAVLQGLEAVGYDGWISVELDFHKLPAAECARLNRQYLASIGY